MTSVRQTSRSAIESVRPKNTETSIHSFVAMQSFIYLPEMANPPESLEEKFTQTCFTAAKRQFNSHLEKPHFKRERKKKLISTQAIQGK